MLFVRVCRWAAGPELFWAAGYQNSVYLDGDIITVPRFYLGLLGQLPGKFHCGGLQTELLSFLGSGGDSSMVAASPESSLGVMLAALGAGQDTFEAHASTFGTSLLRLFWERLTVRWKLLIMKSYMRICCHHLI